MANNRRKFPIKSPKPAPCEECIELKYTPSFVEALQYVRNFNTAQASADWYHLNGHVVFVK